MLALAAVALSLACASAWNFTTPLDEYVALPDPSYTYYDTGNTIKGPGFTGYILNMTSQTWLTYNDVSRSVWWHYLVVIVPDKVQFTDTATIWVTGGSNTDGYPNIQSEDIQVSAALALTDHIITAALFQIPNQPIVFAADPTHAERSEDAMVAFTWYHYININSSEPFWLARLPMTKAVVRAMDTVTSYVAEKFQHDVSQFIIAGASKRGWTTWTTAAVDLRVIAIVPMVMDALNFIPNIHHFWRAYGGWTFALNDYYDLNFTRQIDLPATAQMFGVVDPYVYRSRLTMPKLVVDAGGDEFFMPDDNHYWWDEMPGEKHILFIQDAEHSLATGIQEIIPSVAAFVWGVLNNSPRPSMTWDWYNGTEYGNLTVYTSEQPLKVTVWYADTIQDERRDWRLVTGQNPCPTIVVSGYCFQPVLWFKDKVPTIVNDTTYTVTMDAPEMGWRAFFITVEFPGTGISNYRFSTQVVITPNTFPYAPCEGNGCYGTLL